MRRESYSNRFATALEGVDLDNPGVALVAGQRLGRKDGTYKKWQSRIANGVRGRILKDGTRDTGCGLKAFRREVYLRLPYFDALHRFMPALVKREGYGMIVVESAAAGVPSVVTREPDLDTTYAVTPQQAMLR